MLVFFAHQIEPAVSVAVFSCTLDVSVAVCLAHWM